MDSAAPKRRRRWLWGIAIVALVLVCADGAAHLLVARTRIRRRLTARLEAAFGRPVEVGSYGFSILPVPRLIAYSISVAEEPRFGYEYFLRAESLTASLRWQPLLRGRIELGTLSFSHPS